MRKTVTTLAALGMALSITSTAAAQQGGFDPQRLFFGAGVGFNEIPNSDTATGYQFFGGYEFGEVARNVLIDAEVGYMNTGDMEVSVNVPLLGRVTTETRAKGLWSTGVARLVMTPDVELIGRAGLDFGDDDGLMLGIGAGFAVNRQTKLRLELVERDEVTSLQLNVVYKP